MTKNSPTGAKNWLTYLVFFIRAKKSDRLLGYLTLLIGSIIVTLWTIFRFATKSINFDLVGQQLLSRQWLDGNLEGSVTAPTNYILKMATLYMPSDILAIDPKLFLMLSTICINIATFAGLYFILKLILKYFSVKPGAFFNVSMLWLAMVAGSVFWIQFTNSRNLELVAGLFVIYLGLLIYRKVTPLKCTAFTILAGLTYFADPMQLMVTSVILVTFILADSLFLQKDKASHGKSLLIIFLVAVGYVLSLGLVHFVKHITNVEFFTVSSLSQSLAVFSNLPTAAIETGKNILRLTAGTNEMGVWRQVLSLLLVLVLSGLAAYSLIWKKSYRKYASLTLFISIALIVPIGVYVASGQPLFQVDTSRYVIVLAPALVLLFSVLDMHLLPSVLRQATLIGACAIVTIGAGSLLLSTVNAAPKGLLASDSIEARYLYLQENSYTYGYASMDTSIPAMYLFGKNKEEVLLPLSCDASGLRKATLFFDLSLIHI